MTLLKTRMVWFYCFVFFFVGYGKDFPMQMGNVVNNHVAKVSPKIDSLLPFIEVIQKLLSSNCVCVCVLDRNEVFCMQKIIHY